MAFEHTGLSADFFKFWRHAKTSLFLLSPYNELCKKSAWEAQVHFVGSAPMVRAESRQEVLLVKTPPAGENRKSIIVEFLTRGRSSFIFCVMRLVRPGQRCEEYL